jgi:hypothetical protein
MNESGEQYITEPELIEINGLLSTLNYNRDVFKNVSFDVRVWDVNGEILGVIELNAPGYVFRPEGFGE